MRGHGFRAYFPSRNYRRVTRGRSKVSATHTPGRRLCAPTSCKRPRRFDGLFMPAPSHLRRTYSATLATSTRCPGTGNGCTSRRRTRYRSTSVTHLVWSRRRPDSGRGSAHRSRLLSLVGQGTHKKHRCADLRCATCRGRRNWWRNSRYSRSSTGGNCCWRHGREKRVRKRHRYRRRSSERSKHTHS